MTWIETERDFMLTRSRRDEAFTKYGAHYDLLAPHIGTINCVLDIGCGLGVMDVYLARHHSTRFVHLVDGVGKAVRRKGYEHTATEPWHSVRDGHAFVISEAPLATVSAHVVDGSMPSFDPAPDLIMSLFSCGFHYPVETYLPWFHAYPRARVLLDIRLHRKLAVDGVKTMQKAGYEIEAVVMQYDKGVRVLFTSSDAAADRR